MYIRRRTFFCTLLIVAILFSSLSVPTFGSAAELTADTTIFTGKFEHGDFEGTKDEIKVNWPWFNDWGCFDLSTEENHTQGGSQCLVVKPTGNAWQSFTYKDNNGDSGIEIIPGAKYRVSFWHKGAANGQLQVGDWGLEGNITGYKAVGQADADWTYYYKDFTANGRTRIAPIDLKNTVDGATAGASSYFDDFNIEMIEPPATPKPAKPLTEEETLAGKRENMEIGTNFWFHTSWSACTPMKNNVNWATAYANGDNIWNQTFIDEIEPFTTLRFMDWNNTNGSTIVNWSERRLPTDPGNADIGMSGPGIAYEWMIDLCNRYDKNPWVCLPSSASDDYMREVAKIFKEKLESGRKLYIEYSNEVWNGGFQQYRYCEDMGKKTTEIGLTEETKFTDNYNANYYVYRSFQMFNIFEDVYGYDEMGKSCIRICATSGNMALFDAGYENVFYSKIYNPRDQRADFLAVAPYVGSGLDGNHLEIRDLFHEAIDSSLDSYVKSAYNMGKKYGLPLMAYEGGQHLLLGADAWSRNSEIYAQYIYMLNKFAPYFELYCHYCLTGAWGSGGSWGANAYTGQPIEEAHKLRALYDWIKAPTNEYEKISFPEGAPGNASFQEGMNYWDSTAVEGTVNVVTNSTDEEDVNHPHYLAFTCTNSNNGGKHVETVFRLEPGETYTMKYDVICRVPDRSGTRDFNFYIYDYETNERLGGKNWSSTRWSTMTIDSFTVPAGGNGLVKIRFSLNSWDPSGSCTMEGKVDNFRVYKVGEAEPSNPQLPTGTYVYQRAELPKITPLPRVTPTPTATTKPTVKPTVKPTPTATAKPTVKPSNTPTPTPAFEDDVVYSADFNNGEAGSAWNGYSVVEDPKDTTNKVISYTENNWKPKLTESLLSGCDPNQIYTIMFKVYGDAAHVALSYGQGFEIVATSNDKDTKNGIVSMDQQYYEGLYTRPVANEWNTYVATFKGYSQYKLYLMTQCDNNVNGGTALFDDIKIYKGDYFAELMEQIENSKPTATPEVTPSTTPSETPKVTPSAPVDQPTAGVTTLPGKDDLALAKESAKAELRKYVNLDDYAEAEKKYINDFLAKADKDIDVMTSVAAIAQYLDVSKKLLDKVLTAAELEALGAKKVKKVKFVKKKVKLKVRKQTILKVKLTPKKLSKAAKIVTWSIDKKGKKVVKFVKKANKLRGKLKVNIKALKKGKAKITCKAPSGKKAVCSVIVK